MGNITELISDLDAKRAKATQGEWQQYPDGASLHMEDRCGIVSKEGWKCAERPKNYVAMSWGDKGAMDLNDAGYIIALHNAFLELRQAVLDGERYKAAGEALAEAVAKITHCDNDEYRDYSEIHDVIVNNRDAALTAYHSATNQNEV